ncbi:hypothetical protein P4S65_15130 [Pseudoalteromonas sp. B131b]|uniref:hypothetical protein n=1 Tax=Pseudoalteromonas sp. B131b TaxID=630493 RepID=UPI00301BB1A5
MSKRMIKFTPIAASVALTLGLTACGSDNDRNVYVPPVESFSSSDDAQFNVEVTGKAVKGAMMNAVVSVSTLDATGQSVPVAFRLEASSEAESFSGEGLSQDAADADLEANKIAGNPDDVLTNESGRYSIFLEDNFTGPVYITVKTSAEGDESFLRCDAYLGCGSYATAPEVDDVNDGDTAIEFGEWYKTDLELSVIKFVPAITADTSGASGAQGDPGVSRSLRANATFLTTIGSQLLLESQIEVHPTFIAEVNMSSLFQLMGPDNTFLIPELLADPSNGGAVDLSDVDGEEELSEGILAISQIASSIQGLDSISDVLSKLKTGIKDGKLNGSDDTEIAALAAKLQQAVTNTSNIFLAVATGDDAAIEAAILNAFNVVNPNATDAEKDAFILQAAGIAAKAKAAKNKAIKNGAATDASLALIAKKVKKALEKLGCTDNCEADDNFYAQLAVSVTAEVTASEAELVTLQALVVTAETNLADAQSLGGDTVTDAASAVAFVSAVATLVNEAETADLANKVNKLFIKSQGLVSAATLLVDQNNTYQQILDNAEDLLSDANTEVDKVSAFDAALAELVIAADAAVTEFDVEVTAAKAIAIDAADVADAKQTLSMTAEAASTSALADAQNATIDTAVNAAAALELATAAVSAASEFAASVDALEIAIAQAKAAAQAYLDVAVTDEDKDAAQTLVDDADAMVKVATDKAELASEQFTAALALQVAAEEALPKLTVLASVKATSESLATMTVLTSTGGDAIIDAAEIVADVIDEVSGMGDSASGTSTRFPNWAYNYSLDDLTLMLSNATTGEMINAAASYEGDKLVVAWGATLVGENDASIKLVTADTQVAALTDCVEFAAGTIDATQIDSCLVFTFDGAVSADNVDDAEIIMTETTNHIEIMDGDSGFNGVLSITADEETDSSSISLEGVSGDVDFKVMTTYLDSDMEEASALDITVNNAMGYTLSITGNESAGYTGDVMAMYNEMMISFGTAAKTTNGLSITYIDGDVVDYTDVDLIDSSK